MALIIVSATSRTAPWSDVRSGLFATVAEWAAKREMPGAQERAWKPSMLAPVRSTDELRGSYRFLKASINRIGAILYAAHPVTSMGREQVINVWIHERSPEWEIGLKTSNLDLSLLLAYQIANNWSGTINLITIITDDSERENGQNFMEQLIKLGRMPRGTQAYVEVGTLNDYLPNAPQADLNIFGLQSHNVSLTFAQQMVEATNASCIFVRDSGNESALA